MTFKKNIDLVKISDISRKKSDKIGVVGISPFLPDAMDSFSLKVN
jgi:hypothetical protein